MHIVPVACLHILWLLMPYDFCRLLLHVSVTGSVRFLYFQDCVTASRAYLSSVWKAGALCSKWNCHIHHDSADENISKKDPASSTGLFVQLLSGSRPTWFVSLGSGAKDTQRVAVIKKDTYDNSHSASLYLNGNTSQFFAQPVPDRSAHGSLQNRSFFIYRGILPVATVLPL